MHIFLPRQTLLDLSPLDPTGGGERQGAVVDVRAFPGQVTLSRHGLIVRRVGDQGELEIRIR